MSDKKATTASPGDAKPAASPAPAPAAEAKPKKPPRKMPSDTRIMDRCTKELEGLTKASQRKVLDFLHASWSDGSLAHADDPKPRADQPTLFHNQGLAVPPNPGQI